MTTKPPKPLDAREARFVEEYLSDLDPQRAAIAAGYSATTARTVAYQWVSSSSKTEHAKPHVIAAIQKAKARRAATAEVEAAQVLIELGAISFADPADVLHVDDAGRVTVKPLGKMSARARRSISKITQVARVMKDGAVETRTSIEFHSKVVALRMLADHLGLDAVKRIELETVTDDAFRSLLGLLKRELPKELFEKVLQAAMRAKGIETSAGTSN